MTFSPQQLERLLQRFEVSKRPLPPIEASLAETLVDTQGESYSSNLRGLSQEPATPPALAPSGAVPPREAPPPSEVPLGPPDLDAGFAEFSGRPAKKTGLPTGAKNVKCHKIERDPDTGRITQVYTYDLEEELKDGS